MRLSRVSRGRAVALGAAAAFVLACGCPALARAAEGDYTIYPTPHEVVYAGGEVDFDGTVNTIVESGIDGYTKTRLAETLALAGVEGTPADATSEDGEGLEGLEVLVGIEGSGGAVDTFVDGLEQSGAASVDDALFTKTDSYFLAAIPASGDAPDRIVVLGRDTDSAFYGLTTLYQVLQQDADGAIDAISVSDWADVETRGFIEGYYGNPWSTEDRCELMRWGGYYKLNAYVYAPKDDPKHNAQWRDLYTTEELEDISALAEAGNASKCRFIYALHPFMNDPIQFGSTYEQDLADIKAKYLQVIEAGCRQIMVSADDAADPGSSNYVRLLNDLTDWIHELQAMKNTDGSLKYEGLKDIIPFVAANYAAAGESWYNQLPDNIRPIMTGTRVWGKADNSTISQFINKSGTEPFMWINWPCTDNTRDHLSMGGYENALGADVEPGTLLGCVINPMQQSEPSKVGIFMNADFSWNNWTSYDHADRAWRDAFSHVENGSPVATDASDALRELSEHMKWYQGGGVTFESRESEAVKPMLDAFRAKVEDGTVTVDDLAEIEEFFSGLAEATETYKTSEGNAAMREQIDPWIGFWEDGTEAALRYLKAIRAHLENDVDGLLIEYTQGKGAFDAALMHGYSYVEDIQYARAGTRAVWPVVEAMGEYLRPIASDATGTVEVQTEVTLKGLGTTNPLGNLTDGDTSTTVHFSGSNATTNVEVGDSLTLSYDPYVTADSMTIVQSVPDGRPQDVMRDALVEYTTDGEAWVELGHIDGTAEQTLDFPETVQLKGLRFTNKQYYNGYWQVNEISLGTSAAKMSEPFASVEPTEGTVAALMDGETSTGATFAAPAEGMNAGITFVKATEVGQLAISQGSSPRAGVIEGLVSGMWTKLGDFAATADQTVTFEANTALTSLRLVVEGEGAWTLNELTASRLPSTTTPVMNDTMAEYESYTLDKVTDGNTGTYAHLKNVESNNIRQGDWVGVTFEPSKRVGKVTFVQEGNGDCIAKGEISYQGEDGEWYKIGDVDASGTQTFEFPNVNVKAIRVTNLENTSKWWKVYEITAEEGVESPAGAIVNNDSSIALSGVANETSATITGGEVTFEPGAYAAIDLASLRSDIAISQETLDALADSGLTLVYSTNGLGWNAIEGGHVDSARYAGVRNETAEAVTFDFSAAPISLTFSAASAAFVSTSEAVEGAETDKMLDGSLTTYWRPVDERGTLTYLVSDPLSDGLPRDGVRILSWGEPSGATVSAKVYTSADYATTQEIELGTLEHSITDLSFSEAVKATGAEFYGVESISISWNGTVPSLAEVSMLGATYEPPTEPEPGVDKSELKAAVDAASQLVESDYTAESWAPFAEALAAAEGVLADEDATAADVASALDALKAAQAALVEAPEEPEVNYDELKAAIEAAEALSEDDYTPSSWAALETALAAAQDALASTDQEVVDGAAAALNDAVSALVERADTSALAAAIDAAEALDTTGKTEESVAALKAAVEAGREVLANAGATQDMVDAATQAIADAIAGLEDVETPTVDTSKLAEAVADALTLKESDYTADSWAAFVAAREAAEAVLADVDATQAEVDDALAALEAARAALVEDTTEPGGEPGEEPGEEPGDKPGEGQQPGDKPGDKPGDATKPGSGEEVPQTGDPSSLAAAATAGIAGVATAAAALVTSRKARRG